MEVSMAGAIKKMLDEIIAKRSNGNVTMMNLTKTKLILKGLNPDKFSATSGDDPAIIQKIRQAAQEMGVSI
jgi:hypothetical protein